LLVASEIFLPKVLKSAIF